MAEAVAPAPAPAPASAPVLFEERAAGGGRFVGFATLNVEKALNALNLDMIRLLDAQLRLWAVDPAIACVVLRGAGEKAFCAGGDVRGLRNSILESGGKLPNPGAESFFSEEYRLDHRIHTYGKPILLWGSGIVMGGGLGLMAGASHRVVTETSRIAMPEITIGLFPDVGGSWFLPRMPGRTGLFLALTGASINAADALYLGLADYSLRAADRDALFEKVLAAEWTASPQANDELMSRVLHGFAAPELAASNVRVHFDAIQQLTAGGSLDEVKALVTGYAGDDAWLKRAAGALAAGSPTSAALIWALWHRAKHLGIADVFRTELIVSLQCCAHPDFAEGVRALLIDKDNAPKWVPADQVDAAWVDGFFAAPWPASEHPLADL